MFLYPENFIANYHTHGFSNNSMDMTALYICYTFLTLTLFALILIFSCSTLIILYESQWPVYWIQKGYIGEFEIVDDRRAQKIVVELNGRLNKCGVISPRFDVDYKNLEKWVVNLLPSRQFGHVVISTTYGIMTHEEARRKKTGGKILGFFY